MTEIVVILLLVVANGVLSGAEMAVVSLRLSRLKALVAQGSRSALAVQRLRADPERFLATVQIGITVVGAAAGAFGGATFAKRLEPLFGKVAALEPYASQLALTVVVALVSYLSLVLGELVPKSLALRAADRYALIVARPMLGLATLTRPLVWFLSASSNVVLRLFGDRTSFIEGRLSQDELRQMVGEAAAVGTVHRQVGEIATRALDFGGLSAGDVMVSRPQVVALSSAATADELRRIFLEHTHTRMPVYEGAIDKVIGYVSVKDVLAVAWEQHIIILHDIIRPAFCVPETKPAIDLLSEMRRQRQPFAIVVDEQGGMAGIVTIEDLVEELVGEIQSEHDHHTSEAVKPEADGVYLALGTATIRDVNRAAGTALPEGDDWTTIAGLWLSLAHRIPQIGEQIQLEDGTRLEVVDASPRRIRTLRVRAAAKPPG